MNKYSLIFIGEQMNKKVVRITNKPSFYDALLLSNQTPQPTKIIPYQSIPIRKNTTLSIRYRDDIIQLTYQGNSIQIIADNRELSEKEVFELLHNFAVKEGDRVTFLRTFCHSKTRLRKRKRHRVIEECKTIVVD
jgi:hypothetical protein